MARTRTQEPGIAVLRSEHWAGWRRLVPLAIGLYPFLAMFPFVAITPEPNLLAIAGWGILWTLLGIAMRPTPATNAAPGTHQPHERGVAARTVRRATFDELS